MFFEIGLFDCLNVLIVDDEVDYGDGLSELNEAFDVLFVVPECL